MSKSIRKGSGEVLILRNFIILYRSPNIVRVIKSGRLRWAGSVVRMEVEVQVGIKSAESKTRNTNIIGLLCINNEK